MDLIRVQNTPYFFEILISKSDFGPVKVLGLSRNGPQEQLDKINGASQHLGLSLRTITYNNCCG